jgi:hypothetical protein
VPWHDIDLHDGLKMGFYGISLHIATNYRRG